MYVGQKSKVFAVIIPREKTWRRYFVPNTMTPVYNDHWIIWSLKPCGLSRQADKYVFIRTVPGTLKTDPPTFSIFSAENKAFPKGHANIIRLIMACETLITFDACHAMIRRYDIVNPCHAEFILKGTIHIYLYLVASLNTVTTQVAEILPRGM